ncbi:P-loop containing nucleoside triphosphate hydrolase protein [Melanogaster broomeanus]|nr:P-loop containing nucleoside triphosphate hydrolase protein [Melanogaster broomeanus]
MKGTTAVYNHHFTPPLNFSMTSTAFQIITHTSTGSTSSGVMMGSTDPDDLFLDSATVTARNDSQRVGLSDPTNNHNRKEMLDLVNRLRNTGVESDIELPMIAVIGSQSAGKSSLIESISGITLPRSTGTCTRCPTECKLSYSDAPWKCIVKLHFSTDSKGRPSVRNPAFGPAITDKSQVQDRIRRAQLAILNPSKDHNRFLDGEGPEENELSFSKDYVSLEISGRDLADLSFVDLPGLIASVGSGGNDKDIELVKSLVTHYIRKESCVILLTVACETDFENQGAHHLAKKYDPEGKRTVGVLTKPDRIQPGDESSWIKILRNETEPLVNHWYCVKQPSSKELSMGITWGEARSQESEYFTYTRPWCDLEPQYQQYLRTSNLTERLSVILSELITKKLPQIQEELNNALQDTEANDPVGDVLHVLSNFTRALSRRLEGTPDEDGLLQTIRPHEETFKRAIRATAPNFVPWEKSEPSRDLPKAEFLANEEGYNEPVSLTSQKIYIDEVLQRAQSARTRELPDNYPFVVQKAYIEQFTKRWKLPAMDLYDAVYRILKADLAKLVEEHFAHLGKGNAKQSVLMIVHEHLDAAAKQTKARIEWLLDVESTPATLNTHYYCDYKDKFLSYYKGCRDDSDLLSKLKRYRDPMNGAVSNIYQSSVSKVLSGLSELGITGVKPIDLPKLLASDPMEPALNIMAGVRAYFQVAYKRFADMVPMAIDYEIVRGLERDIDKALQEGLQITGPEGYDRCKALLQELSSVASQRHDIQQKLERLQAARYELKRLM